MQPGNEAPHDGHGKMLFILGKLMLIMTGFLLLIWLVQRVLLYLL
ncbi:MAG: hypothetical protein AB7O62_25805 [Pirellulales bacterium]